MMGDNRGESTTAASGDPSPRLDHRQGLRHLLAARAASASSEPASAGRAARAAGADAAPPGRRLFAFDRALGAASSPAPTRPGAAASPGRWSPPAVLFDYERLGVAERRALAALDDSKQHDEAAREALYPSCMRAAARVAVVSAACAGSTSAACT